ncbi:MAG: response regulator [Lachnospiraceae bacterium]|nr:response regulator [Lachnospiraceae bacterium]
MTEINSSKTVPRVLVVDDVEANRFILRDIISEMGFQPILAENGLQALKIVQRIRPQLMVLDIAMPEMNGYEVCEKIKADPETRDIPIIFISAFDDPKDVVKGFDYGCEDYITKPFIPEVVKVRIGMQLKLYEANTQMSEMNRQLQAAFNEQLKKIEKERRSVLYALLRMARENARYDDSYMDRLSHNCRILAEAMQLSSTYDHIVSDAYVDMIELAAPLCDLGNMAVPTDILQKQSALTTEEAYVMRRHTVIGAEILEDVASAGNNSSFIQMAIEIANYHHENWDGSGYPEGRKGNEIPLSAQIVGTVGAYCALTEDRTYRNAFTQEKALEIMEQDSNVKFNPEIFWILKKIARQLH